MTKANGRGPAKATSTEEDPAPSWPKRPQSLSHFFLETLGGETMHRTIARTIALTLLILGLPSLAGCTTNGPETVATVPVPERSGTEPALVMVFNGTSMADDVGVGAHPDDDACLVAGRAGSFGWRHGTFRIPSDLNVTHGLIEVTWDASALNSELFAFAFLDLGEGNGRTILAEAQGESPLWLVFDGDDVDRSRLGVGFARPCPVQVLPDQEIHWEATIYFQGASS